MKGGPIFQLTEICPKCKKSYWTINNKCSDEKCGHDRTEDIKRARASFKSFLKEGKK